MKYTKKIGLALGSGGWRGGVHIGVIKTLENNGVTVDYIAGTSAGSIVGGLYAYKKDIDKVEEVFKLFKGTALAKAFSDISGNGGILKGKNFAKYLDEYLNGATVQNTEIPFIAVASDLLSGKTVQIKHGDLAEALQTSSTIPILFEPKRKEDKYLVDGGITSPIPVDVVREMGADIVIAVDTLGGLFPIDKVELGKLNSNKAGQISLRVLLESLSREETKRADIIINPKVPGAELGFILKTKTNKHIDKYGEEAAEKIIPELKKLLQK